MFIFNSKAKNLHKKNVIEQSLKKKTLGNKCFFFFKMNEKSHRNWKKKSKKTFEDEIKKNEVKNRKKTKQI
jgi:hypothetical protein